MGLFRKKVCTICGGKTGCITYLLPPCVVPALGLRLNIPELLSDIGYSSLDICTKNRWM